MIKKRVLFLCTHNSCRSQMAEGLLNHDLGEHYEAYSAGTEATQVNMRAIQVMAEIGIDISGHVSKTMDAFHGQSFDWVVTLCGDANEKCPLFVGGVRRMHMGFDDPSQVAGGDEEIMQAFRRTRDEIRSWQQLYF